MPNDDLAGDPATEQSGFSSTLPYAVADGSGLNEVAQ
jgi:hypothetical protein